MHSCRFSFLRVPIQWLRFIMIPALTGWVHGRALPVVVLDPGHGGHDRGASYGGVAEKTLTLQISRRVERHLRARGFRTAMTRRADRYRSLEARAATANAFRRCLFVSIHCNADRHRVARGIETFYFGSGGRRLAAAIHRRMDRCTQCPNRGLKCRGFTVLRGTRCPAALVECGFLSCPPERRLLTTPAYQERMSRAIADGIAATARR